MTGHSKWTKIRHQKAVQIKILIQSMCKVIVASCIRGGDEAVARLSEAGA